MKPYRFSLSPLCQDVCAYYVTSSKLIWVFPTVSRTQQWDLDDYVIAKDILIAGQSIQLVTLDNLQPTYMYVYVCVGTFLHLSKLDFLVLFV